MKKVSIFLVLSFLFTSCAKNSIEPKEPELLNNTSSKLQKNSNLTYKYIHNEGKSKKIKVTSKTKNTLKKSTIKKPIEVARVCYDKKGIAHNCNYKIKKPYLQEQSLYNLR